MIQSFVWSFSVFQCIAAYTPGLEGVIDDRFQHQAVADVRRTTEVKHVYGPQRGVSIAQPAGGAQRWDSMLELKLTLLSPLYPAIPVMRVAAWRRPTWQQW